MTHRDLEKPGDIISQRRKELQMTQTEVSRTLGYKNPNFLSMIERNDSLVPFDRALEYAALLEIEPGWFLERVLRHQYPRTAEFLFNRTTLERLLKDREASDLPVITPGEGRKS
ncbi:helix-turn-helix domain-containing protein [Niveispirillum sp. KHB5.9]|uniref:helix-turn-helix domain-containing protein n=1 Tax=Niveispirillum sp. KHB5.9 TaxID=3400269 RepID=UPI003A8917D8